MKINKLLLTIMTVATFALVGCQQKNEVNTSKLESSFKSAEPATQSSAQKAVSAIKAGDYGAATVELNALAQKANLTPEQQQAINDVVAQLKQMVNDTAKKMGEDASKAVGDLQNPLKK